MLSSRLFNRPHLNNAFRIISLSALMVVQVFAIRLVVSIQRSELILCIKSQSFLQVLLEMMFLHGF